MTLTSLITLNAILAGLVIYGIVWLLGWAIHSDRAPGHVVESPRRADDRPTRIAA